ncbi:hypothetical protein HID58_046296 [Brassica napus]|uniref:Uncharacterized protein n=2 Tax=Brassica napus TaxID=3708 RepID=A0ABQ8AW49_BRANA|nr:hypothetical protein HID58_046296 [Brassica napus]
MKTLKDIYKLNRLLILRLKVFPEKIVSFYNATCNNGGLLNFATMVAYQTFFFTGFWETRYLNKEGELIGVDMLLLDEKVTLIQGFIGENLLNTFRHLQIRKNPPWRNRSRSRVMSPGFFDSGRR